MLQYQVPCVFPSMKMLQAGGRMSKNITRLGSEAGKSVLALVKDASKYF